MGADEGVWNLNERHFNFFNRQHNDALSGYFLKIKKILKELNLYFFTILIIINFLL